MTPIFHSAVRTIENLFDPQTIVLGGLAPDDLIAALVATTENLPTSISSRYDRTTPRVIASVGHQSVLRGAAALAVSGVLSPRQDQAAISGRMRKRDPFSNGMAA